jgi:hypothetical protein
MDMAPPPTGSRIQDLGDLLIVHFRPKRLWGVLAFLAVWLTFWTAGGIAAFIQLLHADWGTRLFLFLWLCFWAFGESTAATIIAWQLLGRELLLVSRERLEVRKQIGPLTKTKLYEAPLVRDLEAARAPSDEDERPRKDFCLAFGYDDKTVRVGEGMSEREAEHIAATVSARIRPRTWWGEDSPAEPYEPPLEGAAPAAPGRRRLGILPQVVFPLLVVVAILSLAVSIRRDSHGERAPQAAPADASPRGPVWPPTQDQFASMRVLASATTFQALTSAKTTVLSQPACRPHPTWQEWTCTVTARPTLPPLAGRTLRYRCSVVSTPPPGGGRAGRGVLCGPDPPRPLGR